MPLVTRYAKSADIHVACQFFGQGSLNLIFAPLRVKYGALLRATPLGSLVASRRLLRRVGEGIGAIQESARCVTIRNTFREAAERSPFSR